MSDNYFIRNRETGKIELHFDKATYQGLSAELKGKIKSYFLWSRGACAWVSKGRADGYCLIIAKNLSLTDAGETGERLSFAEQQERKAERAEARADRMEARAEKAADRGQGLQADFNHLRQDHAFVFQPSMPWSAKGRAFDNLRARIMARYDKGFEEYRKSEYYTRQAEIAGRTASQVKLRNPAFLDRRIKEAEAEIRQIERLMEKYPEETEYTRHLAERFEEVSDKLNFYKAKLEEIGGPAFSKENVKAGDVVRIRGNWCKVQRANPTTVSIVIIEGGARGFELKYPYAEIKEVRA